MQIAAHFTQYKDTENPLLAPLKILSEKYSDIKFTFFVETVIPELPKNCTQVIISPKPTNNFLLLFWYKFKLHNFLRLRVKMVFIGDAGLICEQSKIPHYLFFSKENLLQSKNILFKNKLIKGLIN